MSQIIRVIEDDPNLAEVLRMNLVDRGWVVALPIEADYEKLLTPEAWMGVTTAIIDHFLGHEVMGADILSYLRDNFPHIRRILYTASDQVVKDFGYLAHVSLTKTIDIHTLLSYIKAPSEAE